MLLAPESFKNKIQSSLTFIILKTLFMVDNHIYLKVLYKQTPSAEGHE